MGIPRAADYVPTAKRAKDNAPPIAAELVKGAAFATRAYGPNPKPMSQKTAESKGRDLLSALYKSAENTKLNRAKVLKGLNDSTMSQFLRAYNGMPQNDWMNQMTAAVQELAASVGKSISISSPLTTSFAPYDLVAPTRLTYPVNL